MRKISSDASDETAIVGQTSEASSRGGRDVGDVKSKQEVRNLVEPKLGERNGLLRQTFSYSSPPHWQAATSARPQASSTVDTPDAHFALGEATPMIKNG